MGCIYQEPLSWTYECLVWPSIPAQGELKPFVNGLQVLRVRIIFLNIRRRPTSPLREPELFVWPWFCAWLIPHSSQSLHALNKTGVVQLIVGNQTSAAQINGAHHLSDWTSGWTAQILSCFFLTPKKWQMQKFWNFFLVTSGDKSTWRPLERRHKRLYACFRLYTS